MRPHDAVDPSSNAAVFRAVMDPRGRRAARRSLPRRIAPWALAFAAHLLLLALALRAQPSLETWSARMAAEIHAALAAQAPTQIEPPPAPAPEAPPPAPEPEAQPESRPEPAPRPAPAAPPPSARAPRSRPTPAPPADAAQVVTAPETAARPPVADLTDQAFVVGSADAYAGGATTPGGTRDTPPAPEAADTGPSPAVAPARPSRARPVSLDADAWDCPWPRQAMDADVFEKTVVLRVRVDRRGRVQTATLVQDPGLGFGEAALRCARATRFTPARGDDGRPIASTSPPVRVRFTR